MRVVAFVPLILVSRDVWQTDSRAFVNLLRTQSAPPGATGTIDGASAAAPNDLWVVHRDQSTHPATALVTGLLSTNATTSYLAYGGLALGSFDGPAIATGDFTTQPGLTTPADGLAIVNRGRHNLCVVQFQ